LIDRSSTAERKSGAQCRGENQVEFHDEKNELFNFSNKNSSKNFECDERDCNNCKEETITFVFL
jgi:hypothetical protein